MFDLLEPLRGFFVTLLQDWPAFACKRCLQGSLKTEDFQLNYTHSVKTRQSQRFRV